MKGGHETVADIKDALIDALDENVELTHKLRLALAAKEKAEAKLCRAREAIEGAIPALKAREEEDGSTDFLIPTLESAPSSPSPCRHAAIAERVEDTEGLVKVISKTWEQDDMITARAVQAFLKGEG